MATVGAYEAKTHLGQLLERAHRGETITITKHGLPVARLVPPPEAPPMTPSEAVDALLECRKHLRFEGLSVEEIREMIEEGRRF